MSTRIFNLLIVDDDHLVHQTIKLGLPAAWKVYSLHSDNYLDPERFYHAAFVDMHLDAASKEPKGLKVIEKLLLHNSQLEVVAMSGDLSRPLMESCLKSGAQRFLPKPLVPEELRLVLEKIEALLDLRNKESVAFAPKTQWIGQGTASDEIRKTIASLKGESTSILIEGETGTGKEVVAKLLHQQEQQRPFVTVNVASIPNNLFESEMFGHIKGAFTGADQNKIGLIEAANGGDLFLDEIEALPLPLQAKLLRFLESGEIRRVGSKDILWIKTRIIAASNRSLKTMVKSEEFREDLFYRLSSQKIVLPPLRDRKEDIAGLAQYFLDSEKPKRNKIFTEDGILELNAYDWPGNVRELKRVCEQLSLISPLPLIRAEDVLRILPRTGAPAVLAIDPRKALDFSKADLAVGLVHLVQTFESEIVKQALKQNKDVESASS
ncbi:MAG: sigma-54-dependent transcriptional regulator, partial [Pseudobdellovibrionaceae bacterium]